jgi:hypothetical protein
MHYVVLARTAALHIGERGFLPIRRGKIPIAGASLVIVPASPVPDSRRAPVIHAHLQQGAGRNPPGPNRTAVKSAQWQRSARGWANRKTAQLASFAVPIQWIRMWVDTPVGRQFLSSSFGFRVRAVMRVFCDGRRSRLLGGRSYKLRAGPDSPYIGGHP